jgi:chorismate mutase
MNRDFEDIRRNVQHLLTDVEPNNPATISHAVTQYILSIPMDKLHRAASPTPRIREVQPLERLDNWMGWNAR